MSAPASTLTARSVSATEDAGYSGNVGSFTPAAGISGHTLVATIGWGDGAVAYGTMTLSSGTYTSGTHTYADDSNSNNPQTVTRFSTPTPASSPARQCERHGGRRRAAVIGNAITAWTGQTTGLIAVATFADSDTASSAGEFTASIDCGDGSADSAGVVQATPGAAPETRASRPAPSICSPSRSAAPSPPPASIPGPRPSRSPAPPWAPFSWRREPDGSDAG